MSAPGHGAVAFGLRWASDVPLHAFAQAPVDGAPDVTIRRVATLAPRDPIVTIANATLCSDGIRFAMEDGVTFDIYPPGRIDWAAGPGWSGTFQPQFFGTLTALLLAWRSNVPIHGTSVEIDGKAWLICGRSGAGKSTLGAALIASGAARLIADDLSLLTGADDAMPLLRAGRPGMRLFPAVARLMEQAGAGTARSEPGNDKLMVEPPRVAPLESIPLAATILLGENEAKLPWQREKLLREHRFRPRWMDAIPGREDRDRVIRRVATVTPMLFVAAADIRDANAFAARANAVLERIRELES
ncbi:hypothetical protein GCM10009087_17350 [Sphingomonas oligophenolica]